jgi:hypothetical protein
MRDLLGTARVVDSRRNAHRKLQGGEGSQWTQQEHNGERCRRQQREKDAWLRESDDSHEVQREASQCQSDRRQQRAQNFGASNSTVVSGVASSGSSVRACFSPMTL